MDISLSSVESIASFAAASAKGDFSAILSAILLASSSNFSGGTTNSINPISLAKDAEILSPKNTIYLAQPLPTSLVNLWVPPPPGIKARLISGCPNSALEEAILISHAIANSSPPPKANPFIAAITGLGNLATVLKRSFLNIALDAGLPDCWKPVTSAPAENALPLPVIMTTLTR
ncbi:hypothetical protein Saci_1135 [Sulfolobus acidocaldarius DSM 639]|uniref:Uncharacterized protein n=1 Tax=Sulfolobus acidocaldarius (strain ATCC 33909 / DSM 639 / JCM 8929 / NBRC 15157 / NCIMB 11770) TaxID=330779 RepID=Q4J9P2_SULAC|nr:hypothetical protein Saci_1135 [Sulfolobus acidocaldarius DSM 639]